MIIISVWAGIAAFLSVDNPLVSTILQSDQHTLLSDRTKLITMENRETSKMKTFPVNYLREGNTVYIGSDVHKMADCLRVSMPSRKTSLSAIPI